ncbi:Tubulin polyglutamylase TTLL5 [Nymphon striatum]|nr:Tubulin polyglutamylase TTLL5 [Nymphon striatum]KAG1708459.1 Tubulin polyglutamylase TTLL5 [Nymphon striatum]
MKLFNQSRYMWRLRHIKKFRPSSSLDRKLTNEESKILLMLKEEEKRSRGFIRIFPAEDTWHLYKNLLEDKSGFNKMVHEQLYGVNIMHPPRSHITLPQSTLKNSKSLGSIADSEIEDLLPSFECNLLLKKNNKSEENPDRSFSCISLHIDDSSTQEQRKQEVLQCLKDKNLSVKQARKAFAFYLELLHMRLLSYAKNSALDQAQQQQISQKIIMVWCGLWKAHVLGPFFFDNHVTGETYLTMLRDQVMPQLERLDEGLSKWFQQDGAHAHFATVDLIQKFIQRASSNLSIQFKCGHYLSKTPLQEKINNVAESLKNFIKCYTKETKIFELDDSNTVGGVDQVIFENFLSTACEEDLQQVLTVSTELNRSSSDLPSASIDSAKDYEATTMAPRPGAFASRVASTQAPVPKVIRKSSRRKDAEILLPQTSNNIRDSAATKETSISTPNNFLSVGKPFENKVKPTKTLFKDLRTKVKAERRDNVKNAKDAFKSKVAQNKSSKNVEIQPIMTGNVALDQVDRYTSLGQLISIHRDWESEVRRRVALDKGENSGQGTNTTSNSTKDIKNRQAAKRNWERASKLAIESLGPRPKKGKAPLGGANMGPKLLQQLAKAPPEITERELWMTSKIPGVPVWVAGICFVLNFLIPGLVVLARQRSLHDAELRDMTTKAFRDNMLRLVDTTRIV